ncbi:hypothetical protein [Oscillatoria acuminata]|nr:hypothetical protein [Oscillatoria acuminata]
MVLIEQPSCEAVVASGPWRSLSPWQRAIATILILNSSFPKSMYWHF